jgi:cytochrome bd-type quinol oxidase subunit 2
MIWVYALIYVPILLFVVGFLYETYLSFARILHKGTGKQTYVSTTWEVTHTLLVFGVVMMLMLFTRHIDVIADAIFIPTFIAMTALFVRGLCYVYLFYITKRATPGVADWIFALSHIVAALFLVIVVLAFTYTLATHTFVANMQFVPPFLIGLAGILLLCAAPLGALYLQKDRH